MKMTGRHQQKSAVQRRLSCSQAPVMLGAHTRAELRALGERRAETPGFPSLRAWARQVSRGKRGSKKALTWLGHLEPPATRLSGLAFLEGASWGARGLSVNTRVALTP